MIMFNEIKVEPTNSANSLEGVYSNIQKLLEEKVVGGAKSSPITQLSTGEFQSLKGFEVLNNQIPFSSAIELIASNRILSTRESAARAIAEAVKDLTNAEQVFDQMCANIKVSTNPYNPAIFTQNYTDDVSFAA